MGIWKSQCWPLQVYVRIIPLPSIVRGLVLISFWFYRLVIYQLTAEVVRLLEYIFIFPLLCSNLKLGAMTGARVGNPMQSTGSDRIQVQTTRRVRLCSVHKLSNSVHRFKDLWTCLISLPILCDIGLSDDATSWARTHACVQVPTLRDVCTRYNNFANKNNINVTESTPAAFATMFRRPIWLLAVAFIVAATVTSADRGLLQTTRFEYKHLDSEPNCA